MFHKSAPSYVGKGECTHEEGRVGTPRPRAAHRDRPRSRRAGLQKERGQLHRTLPAVPSSAAGTSRPVPPIPERLADYPEFLPFLTGWDFRVLNLPPCELPGGRYRYRIRGGASPVSTRTGRRRQGQRDVGSVRPPEQRSLDAQGRGVRPAPLRETTAEPAPTRAAPRRRTSPRSPAGWSVLGTERFRLERPVATVIGQGLGSTTLFVAARRDGDDVLLFTRRPIASTSSTLPGAWESLAAASPVDPRSRLHSGVRSPSHGGSPIRTRSRYASTRPRPRARGPAWGIPGATVGDPQLVWDGTALDLSLRRCRQPPAAAPVRVRPQPRLP